MLTSTLSDLDNLYKGVSLQVVTLKYRLFSMSKATQGTLIKQMMRKLMSGVNT